MAAYKGVVPSGSYTFNASARTITFHVDYNNIALSDVMLVTNVTSNVIIYDPTDATKKGTLSSGTPKVLTLVYDTTTMSNTDVLQIIIGNSTFGSPLPDGASTETTLSALNTKIPTNLTVASNRLQVDTGTVTVIQPTAANLNATVTGTVNVANATGLPTQIYTSATTATSPSTSSATNPIYVSVVEPPVAAILSGNTTTPKSIANVGGSGDYQVIKSGATKLTGWYVYNNSSTGVRIMFFDSASVPASSAIPSFSIVIPAYSASNISFPSGAINFQLGFSLGITSNISSVGAGSNAYVSPAGAVIGTFFYK